MQASGHEFFTCKSYESCVEVIKSLVKRVTPQLA